MNSIRRFLVVVLLAAITLINFLAALQGYRTSMAEAERLFDAQLEDIAEVLAFSLGGSRDRLVPNISSDQRVTFQVWRDDTLELSAGIAAKVARKPIAPLREGYVDMRLYGLRWRAFSTYDEGSGRWLIVAQRADDRFKLAASIIIQSFLPIIIGLPLIGVLIWIIVTRGLAPLRDLASEMSNKRSDDLSPVIAKNPPEELGVLIDAINDLLQRLDGAFERERRFAADAAHELRTPISVLKVRLHNLLRDAGGDRDALRSLKSAVDRMEHSVEQVLMLYRTAPDQFGANFEYVDIATLARKVIADNYPQLEAQNQQIEMAGEHALVQGDSFAITTLITNLIQNASKFSGEGGRIRVKLESPANSVILTVEDNGPGIPADQYDKVFERFYRIGSDRRETEVEGSGIGLAIVRHVADIHKADIKLGPSEFTTGLAVTIAFPKSLG